MRIIRNTLFIYLLLGCTENGVEGDSAYPIIYDNHTHTDCNVYQHIFNEGPCIFRFAIAGQCIQMESTQYIDQYRTFLSQRSKDIVLRNGFIRLEFYKETDINESHITKLKRISESLLKVKLSIKKSWNEGIELTPIL